MKKIAIYTLQEYNYGNRLQNYATQEILKAVGYKAFSLYLYSPSENYERLFREHRFLNRFSVCMPILINVESLYRAYIKRDRIGNFKRFNKNIQYAPRSEYIGREAMHISSGEYYAFLAGSDQIWNTSFPTCTINSFFPFPHDRKISFSASFGVESIPFDKKIANCLKQFHAVSVREDAGARIIKNTTGRDATVLVDPTMLLTKEEWQKVSKKPKGAKEGYILTYFLSPKCDKARAELEEITGDRKVYELLNPNDKVAGTAGPAEFLWLINHADLIFTDSFHACVFSFLFNKPFIVYDRNWNKGNMNSRLETLLSKFHLDRKYAGSGLPNDIWEHDYSESYKQLEIERKKSTDFLKRALED